MFCLYRKARQVDIPSANSGSSPPPEAGTLQDLKRGQAALLLVESLMHELFVKGILSREDFVQIVDGAAEVEHELNSAAATVPADASGSFLYPLSAAFRRELGG